MPLVIPSKFQSGDKIGVLTDFLYLLSDFCADVLEKTGYARELREEDSVEAQGRLENLQEFINVAREFVVGFLEMIFDWFVALAQYIKTIVNLRNREYQYA